MMFDAPCTFGYCRSQVQILLPRPAKPLIRIEAVLTRRD
jgi:hypothetical protein